MSLIFNNFINDSNISILVNFPFDLIKAVDSSIIGYIFSNKELDDLTVEQFLEKTNVSKEKIIKAMQLVLLPSRLLSVSISCLTKSERLRLQFAELLLKNVDILICKDFFEGMIHSEKEYFKRFFRNLIQKQNKKIIVLENDMNFICETVRKFYLFTNDGKYRLVDDFYDDEIYKYVKMPNTVELIKHLEQIGYKIDHEITFNETLKEIYLGVQ